MPSFAKNIKRKRKEWNKPSRDESKERMHKMDALNLELSETFKEGQMKRVIQGDKQEELIRKGRLLDSLDLNTGFDAIQKHKQDTQKVFDKSLAIHKKPMDYVPAPKVIRAKEKVQEKDLRDSLDEDDFDQFNDRINDTSKPSSQDNKNDHSASDDSEFERADDDTDWLRQSMQESMSNWKKEVDKLQEKIQKEDKVKQN